MKIIIYEEYSQKIKINILLLFLFILFNKYLFFKLFYKNNKNENNIFNKFFNLRDISSLMINDSFIKKEKQKIQNFYLKRQKKKINNLYFTSKARFGNKLVYLNRIILYCEIIECKNIILDKENFWFIKKKIYINNLNITIDLDDNKFNKYYTIYDYYKISDIFFTVKQEIKIHYLRNEIINNLPKVRLYNEDLCIHIRSDDIFSRIPHINYAQPPLCFYINILNNYKFKNIYIISKDRKNPLINKLINYYSYIKFSQNNIKLDISYLINSINIVVSISSFVNSIIQMNYNLKFLWDYNIYKKSEKILHFHYDLYKFPYNNIKIFRMEPSFIYKKIMNKWKNNRKQKKLMLKEKCINDFSLIIKY